MCDVHAYYGFAECYPENFESRLKLTMKQIQKGAKDRCLFSELIKGSIKGVTTLEERFKCLKYTGNTVNIEKPATVEEITDLFQTALLSLGGDFSLPDGDIL